MPTYEFRCPDGHTFDRFYRNMSDAMREVPCPECGKLAVRQLSGGAGLVFKGSGFYLTDYGKNAHRGEAPPSQGSADKAAAPAGEVAGASGSDSKGGDASGRAETAKSGENARSGGGGDFAKRSESGRSGETGRGAESKPAETKASEAKSSDAKSGAPKPSGAASDSSSGKSEK